MNKSTKRLRATAFSIAKFEEQLLNREQKKSNIVIAILEKLRKKYYLNYL